MPAMPRCTTAPCACVCSTPPAARCSAALPGRTLPWPGGPARVCPGSGSPPMARPPPPPPHPPPPPPNRPPRQETPLPQTPIALTAPALQPRTGTVSASPRSVPGGTAVQLLYAAHNPNPGPVPASLTLSIRPTDGTDTSAVAQWPMEHHFGAHTGLTGNQSWTPDGPIGSSYTV